VRATRAHAEPKGRAERLLLFKCPISPTEKHRIKMSATRGAPSCARWETTLSLCVAFLSVCFPFVTSSLMLKQQYICFDFSLERDKLFFSPTFCEPRCVVLASEVFITLETQTVVVKTPFSARTKARQHSCLHPTSATGSDALLLKLFWNRTCKTAPPSFYLSATSTGRLSERPLVIAAHSHGVRLLFL